MLSTSVPDPGPRPGGAAGGRTPFPFAPQTCAELGACRPHRKALCQGRPGSPHRAVCGGSAVADPSPRLPFPPAASPSLAASLLAQIFARNVKKNNREINKKPSDLTQLGYLF